MVSSAVLLAVGATWNSFVLENLCVFVVSTVAWAHGHTDKAVMKPYFFSGQ